MIYNAIRKRWLRLTRKITRPKSVTIMGKALTIDYRWSRTMIRTFHDESYEKTESQILPKILEPSDKVLDVGAAVGLVGMIANDYAESVTMVEANPDIAAIAKQNLERNNASINLIEAAVVAGDQETVTFNLYHNFWAGSLLDRHDVEKKLVKAITVPAVKLSTLIQDHNVLLMDVEGAEHDLLTNTDLTGIDKISVEVHPTAIGNDKVNELTAHLVRSGFTLVLEHTGEDNLYFKR